MYKVASASEYLVITGAGIDDIKLSKKAWILPGQTCRVFDVSPVNYTFEVQAMSAEKLPFVLPAVFTIGPRIDDDEALRKYAKLISPHDKLSNHVKELVQGVIEGETRVLAASMTMEEVFKGKVVKIKRRRAPQISYKTSVIAESYKPMRHSSFDILEDLFIEILSRLPLDSLARFKSVSKQWQHLISNTIITRNVTKLLIVSYLENQGLSFHSLDQEIRVESLCSPMEENLLPSYGVRAHSSFNGFVLIQIKDDLVMWNPLTKFFRNVFHGHDAPYYGVVHEIGLCFDHVNNEYKIVLVKKVSSRSYSAEIFYVASCGASSWEQLIIPNTVKNVYQGPVFNGYKHWICKGRFSPFHQSIPPTRNHIVYFDPSTNEFIEVATPQPKKGDTYAIVGLGVLDGCLCMSCWDDMGNYVEFLSMKEYGNGDSWNILFVISNVPNLHYYDTMEPLFKTKEGEVLVSMNIGRKWSVKTYSVDGNFRRDIFASRRYSFLQLVLYEENWISPTKSFIRL